MKKEKKTLLFSLSKQFGLTLLIFIVCTIVIAVYTTYDFSKMQYDTLEGSLNSYSMQLAKNTSEAYESYENICYNIAYSQTVHDYLQNTTKQSAYDSYQALQNYLNTSSLLNSYIVDIAIYGKNDTFASLCSSKDNYRAFALSLLDTRFPYQAVGTATINQTSCHIMAMPIYSVSSAQNNYLGILFLAIDIDVLLNNSMDHTLYNPQILFLDNDNNLVYGDASLYDALNSSRYFSDTTTSRITSNDSIEYAVSQYSIPIIQHSLYVMIDQTPLNQKIFYLSSLLLLRIGLLFVVFLLFILFFYRPLIRSLKELTQFIQIISSGDRRAYKEGTNIQQGLIGSREIHDIVTAFNEMLANTNQLNHDIFHTYTKMYELEATKRETEIAYLRSQINPHFLYNTLTMICGMAAEGSTDEIISVTGALSQMFRYSVKGSDFVTLEEEMEIVRSYLMIQSERFHDRFEIEYQFADGIMQWKIPKMLIQPLVENAIVHGLEKSLRPGKLVIGAGLNPTHGYLAIWIFDTGVGMPKEKLEEVRSAIHTCAESLTDLSPDNYSHTALKKYDSIGLLNVNSRMVLYYGKEYTLLVDSEEGVGTNIQIRVPSETVRTNDQKRKGESHVSGNCNR